MSEKNEKLKYIGLTIGPIIKTLNLAKRTRDTWAASYLFSFIMKNLIEQLLERGIDKNKILVPHADSINDTGIKLHAGLFPDRLILQAGEGDFEKLKEAAEETMQIIAAGISGKLMVKIEDVRQDLDNYLQIYFLEKKLEPGDNPILKLWPYLDALDRHTKYIHRDSNQTIPRFLKLKKEDFLTGDAGLKRRFESLVEIASRELKNIDKTTYDEIIRKFLFNRQDEDETSIIQALKSNFKDEFKVYHKYIAIVQADGDNIRKTIENYGNDFEALQTFSKNLTAFAREAALLIREYGGTPVYAGGDDLLFFSPVVNRYAKENGVISTENLFDLIDKLDNEFKRKFPEATLSYGISITYYKFPLNEALEEARHQLFQLAKSFKENGKEKNAAAFKILKHSGRSFGTIFYKEIKEQKEKRNIYTLFKDLLSDYGANKKYLNSIVQSLQTHRGIFRELFENVTHQAEKRITNFFNNSFDEPVHHEYRNYIDDAAELVYKVYNTGPSSWKEEQKFQAVYAVLRTLHFFNQEDNERQ